jgi:hypothetical protein
LIETQNILVKSGDILNLKRPRTDDRGGSPEPRGLITLPLKTTTTTPVAYVRSDYPHITYWYKQEWTQVKNNKNNTSRVPASGERGGGRSAKGINVTLLFIQEEDGTPVSGTTTNDIRALARSIWRSFYREGLAPEKWGDATKEVMDHYIHQMENEWDVLRLCDNHWKAKMVATLTYSQWYGGFDRKMKATKGDKPTTKKRRISTEEPDASSPSPPPEARSPSPSSETDLEGPLAESSQAARSILSRPRARSLRNPL